MQSVLLSMSVFAFVGAVSPGPVNIIAASAGAQFGYKKAVFHVLGATFAYTFIVFLCGLGLEQALKMLPEMTGWLTAFGGVFLLYMAFKIATSVGIENAEHLKSAAHPTFFEGVLSQGLNPKAWLVAMSGVSLFVLKHSPTMLYLVIFCAISFVVCFLGVSAWAAAGNYIGRYLSTTKRQVTFNIVMGLLLGGTVVHMFWGY
ncbi:MAG: LysE family translocator [Photobacterium frigidiphilum]|uniref:LysE family translocator n=1 Tax=Photobacterium frigidiphilum TaxID=264736 RepID=UPI003002BB79